MHQEKQLEEKMADTLPANHQPDSQRFRKSDLFTSDLFTFMAI
jgi:hypothetical protein